MTPQELAHARFLWVRWCKGDRLYQEDIDLLLRLEKEAKELIASIEIIREGLQHD